MAEKKYPFDSSRAHSYGKVNQSGSEPNPDYEKEYPYSTLFTSLETTVATEETASLVFDVDKLTSRSDEQIPQTDGGAAADFAYKHEHLFQNHSLIWNPNIYEYNMLTNSNKSSSSWSDELCDIFDKNLLSNNENSYGPPGTSRTFANSVWGKPASVTTATVTTNTAITYTATTATLTPAITTTATSTSTSYADVTASYIPPHTIESPKYINQQLIKSKTRYTIFVKCQPNWYVHLRQLTLKLCQTLTINSYGKGVYIMPKTMSDYKVLLSYLINLLEIQPAIFWFSHMLCSELLTKINIRGLPYEVPISQITDALKEHGLQVQLNPPILVGGRSKYLYTIEFEQQSRKKNSTLISKYYLQYISGVIIDNLHKSKPVQTRYHKTFEKEIGRQNTMKNVLSERILKIDEPKRKRNKKGNKIKESDDENWTTVCRKKKKNFSLLSAPTKTIQKPVEEPSKINRYDTGAETNSNDADSEPTVSRNPTESDIKTKSKKKRERRKNRQDWLDICYTSPYTLNVGAEDRRQNEAISTEINENQDLFIYIDPPSPFRDRPPVQQRVPDNTNTKEMSYVSLIDLLRTVAKNITDINTAMDQRNAAMEAILNAINTFLEENNDGS